MDDARFDRLIVALATSPSRRHLLGTLLGTALGGLLEWEQLNAAKKKGKNKNKNKKKKEKCPNGRDRCGSKCCKADETCKKGKCVHHCEDGEKNFDETGIDCGGACAQVGSSLGKCGIGKGCEVDDDCFSNFCVRKGSEKKCVVCRIDSDCNPTLTGPRCLDNECFPCAADFDCSPEAPFCIEVAGCPNGQPCICGECRVDTDCPEGQLCDEDGRCENVFACEADQDFCRDGITGCNGNDECRCFQTLSNQPFCAFSGSTVECISSADCAPLGPGAECIRIGGGDRCGPTSFTVCALPCS